MLLISAAVLAGLASPLLEARESRRLAPPDHLACERDQLTSYTGTVSEMELTSCEARVVIDTDWDTQEIVVLKADCCDWGSLLDDSGAPVSGLRATAWVCLEGITPPVIDWHIP